MCILDYELGLRQPYINSVRDGATDESAARLSAREQASDFLDGAHSHRKNTEALEKERLLRARDTGSLSKKTTDEEINRYSKRASYHTQASVIVNNPPTCEGLAFLRDKADAAQHPNGATHTHAYGDMRLFGGSKAAKQRANNTRLDNAISLHHIDDEKEDTFASDIDQAIATSLEIADANSPNSWRRQNNLA